MLLPILLGIAMAATLIVLFAGVISFAVGGKFNREYATRLMAARVMLQGVAIAIFALAVALGG
jgi:Hypoxia induced protein conserved region